MVDRERGQWSLSIDWFIPLLVLTHIAWARLASDSRLNSSLVESSRRRGDLLLVGARGAEGAGRSMPLSKSGSAWAC